MRKLTNTTKAIHVQLIAVIARALRFATVLYTLVFTLAPIPTPGLSRLRLSSLGTSWWSRRPSWKENVVFQDTFEVTVVESNYKINFLGLLLYTGYKMIKKGQRSVSINAGTVARYSNDDYKTFPPFISIAVCRLPFVIWRRVLTYMKNMKNKFQEYIAKLVSVGNYYN